MLVPPNVLEYVPVPHSVQVVEVTRDHVPAAHVEHAPLLVAPRTDDQVPALQFRH